MKQQHDGLPPLLNVGNIANGAVYELMGQALTALGANVMDPNTSERQKRKITLTLEATPYPDRSGFGYTVKVETKLAGMRPAEGSAYIARKNGEYIVVGKNHNQLELEMNVNLPENAPDGKPKLV